MKVPKDIHVVKVYRRTLIGYVEKIEIFLGSGQGSQFIQVITHGYSMYLNAHTFQIAKYRPNAIPSRRFIISLLINEQRVGTQQRISDTTTANL